MKKINVVRILFCFSTCLFSTFTYAQVSAFRIECTANDEGNTIQKVFAYSPDYPEMFAVGYLDSSQNDRLNLFELVKVKKQRLDGDGAVYLAVYYNDYPTNKEISQYKLSFLQDSTLKLESVELSRDKTMVEGISEHQKEDFRSCKSDGVW